MAYTFFLLSIIFFLFSACFIAQLLFSRYMYLSYALQSSNELDLNSSLNSFQSNSSLKQRFTLDPVIQALTTIPKPNDDLNIFALPVGNGDCTIVQCPSGELIIIDAGNTGGEGWMEAMIATFLKPQLSKISTLMIMHADRDHFSYIPELFTLNDVPNLERIILGGRKDDYTSPPFRKWLNQHAEVVEYINNGEPCIGKCNNDPPQCNDGKDGVAFRYLGANLGNSVDGRSIMMQINAGPNFQMLLPGDFLGSDIEELLVNEWERRGQPLRSTHLKMSHHGNSIRANSKVFLSAVAPSFAFASASYPGPPEWYPSCESIKTLLNVGSIQLRRVPGRFSCGDEADRKAIQYENWPYSIYTLSPNIGDYEMVTINVPMPPRPHNNYSSILH